MHSNIPQCVFVSPRICHGLTLNCCYTLHKFNYLHVVINKQGREFLRTTFNTNIEIFPKQHGN